MGRPGGGNRDNENSDDICGCAIDPQGLHFHQVEGVQHLDNAWSNLETGIVEAEEGSSNVNNLLWVEATLLPTIRL